jgi:type IV pilus assembly protein PilC
VAKTFAYKAKNMTGQVLTGSILAENEVAVAAHIREKGYFVTQIKVEGGANAVAEFVENLHRVNTKDLALFCRQFSTMIDAGLPIISCLHVLIAQTENRRLQKALQNVYQKIKEGDTLSRSLKDYPRIFPDIMINMIEAGEVGGVLDDILNRLATHFEKEHKLNQKVKSAMTYPIVVMIMAILSVIFILTFVLPTFMEMFISMKMELPLLTRILVAISNFLRNYAPFLLAGVVGLGYGFLHASRQKKSRIIMDEMALKLPTIGTLFHKIAIARFSRTLSTLMRGGVPIITALDVVKKTVGNLSMTAALAKAQVELQEGVGLSATLATSKVFTPMVIQMVAIGEESGALDKMLEKIADFYESEVEDMVGRLSSIIEPVIIGFLGVVIGFIVVSIALPLFDVITNAGKL